MAVGKQLQKPEFKYKLNAEQRLFLRQFGHVVAKLKRDPVIVARLLHGIVVPPHERLVWRSMWREFRENHFLGSRGTAKSSCVQSMGFSMRAETRTSRKILPLSASKFRGGKLIMEEAVDFLFGRFKSQRLPAPFARRFLSQAKGVKREGDRWIIDYRTGSKLATIPTGNHEAARGWRANWLGLDEADNWERAVITKYFEPFLNVGGDFENTGESGGEPNAIFFTGTVTYAHKDWAQMLEDRYKMLQRRYDAQKALSEKDYSVYRRLMAEDNYRLWNLSVAIEKWDYTDLIIPTTILDRETREPKYKVHYPIFNRDTNETEISPSRIMKFDMRDQQQYIYTYPVEKAKIEEALDDGLTDLDVWAAENRCEVINATGGTYPHDLLEAATNTELIETKDLKKFGWNVEQRGSYYPPVLYECKAKCVLGVDPARTADFSAFVVIRLGELEDPNVPYNPLTGEGYTPYNNVIWAEAHRRMTIREHVELIHALKKRYNLTVSSPNPGLAPGVAIDARGTAAGTTIQDELARPTPPVDAQGIPLPNWIQPQPIYDPTGDEYKHLGVGGRSWPGLRLVNASDMTNTEWVSFSKGQMQQKKLYIGKHISQNERYDPEGKLHPGYLGVQSLKSQLSKVQQEHTKYHLKFFIPGDEKKLENKDDLFKAFLYAVSAMRDHLALQTHKKKLAPVAAGIVHKPKSTVFTSMYHRGR